MFGTHTRDGVLLLEPLCAEKKYLSDPYDLWHSFTYSCHSPKKSVSLRPLWNCFKYSCHSQKTQCLSDPCETVSNILATAKKNRVFQTLVKLVQIFLRRCKHKPQFYFSRFFPLFKFRLVSLLLSSLFSFLLLLVVVFRVVVVVPLSQLDVNPQLVWGNLIWTKLVQTNLMWTKLVRIKFQKKNSCVIPNSLEDLGKFLAICPGTLGNLISHLHRNSPELH